MSLRFRNGRYEIDFYPDGRNGKRIQRILAPGIDTDEAEEQYRQIVKRYKKKPGIAVDLGLTISRLVDKYMEWYELHRQPKTVKDVKAVFENHIETALGGIAAEDLDRQHILDYQKKRRISVSGRTVNKETAYLSGCLRWAERNGLISARTWRFENLPHSRPCRGFFLWMRPRELSRPWRKNRFTWHTFFFFTVWVCVWTRPDKSNGRT